MNDVPEASVSPSTSDGSADESAAERQWLSYEGTAFPFSLVLIWIAFLLFGFFYFARYLL